MNAVAIDQFHQFSTSNAIGLVNVIQKLSTIRDLPTLMTTVRTAARTLTGADGATFVLKDGEFCFYAEEDAISPLWKGQRFPLTSCVSGWAMNNKKSVVIPDIYSDHRVPVEAYRPTFVKSLAMMPIRIHDPLGAIGIYWATKRTPTKEEIQTLQVIADSTSLAMENIQLYAELKSKVERLEESNYDLSRFAWMTSHDFREPLRVISIYVSLLQAEVGDKLTDEQIEYIKFAVEGAKRLNRLVDDLLGYFTLGSTKRELQKVSLKEPIHAALENLKEWVIHTGAKVTYDHLPDINGDVNLLTPLFQNIFHNSLKFRRDNVKPRIKIEAKEKDNEWLISIADNGIGFDKTYLEKIFQFFQRLNPQDKYPGSGIGLAVCKKVAEVHKGRIWAKSKPGKGSVFYFSLPKVKFD